MTDKDDIRKLRERLNMLQGEIDSIRAEISRMERGLPPETAAAAPAPAAPAIEAPPPPAAPRKAFSLSEFSLGGNILGKLGLLSIIIAAAWFIKYAFDNRWINESGRIYLGLMAGFGAITWGLSLARRRMRILPAALTGTGASLLYIALFGAYYFYGLLGRSETFLFLAALSIAMAALAGRAGIQALFVWSVAGAFLAPLLVSSGENSYRFLFGYIAIINAVFFLLSRYRSWSLSAYIVIIADFAVFGAWAADKLHESSFAAPFLFMFFVYLVFMACELLLLPRVHGLPGPAWKPMILLNTAGFLFLGAWVMNVFHPSFRPHFMLGVAALSALFYMLFHRYAEGRDEA